MGPADRRADRPAAVDPHREFVLLAAARVGRTGGAGRSRTESEREAVPEDFAAVRHRRQFLPGGGRRRLEFEAKKVEEWWIEVASERFGLPTDPAVLVQQVVRTADGEKATMSPSSAISPAGQSLEQRLRLRRPPYNAGTSDVLGKLVIKEDGVYRLQLTDLFGGTRKDPRNIYRLVVRQAAPDFALVAWAMHMELRNGDRNALSKPLSLRGGATMALEVIALRRDGFDGDIDLVMQGLPEGVTAHGLKIRPDNPAD